MTEEKVTYDSLRETLMKWDRTQQKWSHGNVTGGLTAQEPSPMDIDRIKGYDPKGKGKSKGKGKDKDGKGKPSWSKDGKGAWKGSDPKGKGKSWSKDGKGAWKGTNPKGKGGKNSADNASNACRICGKQGHWERQS